MTSHADVLGRRFVTLVLSIAANLLTPGMKPLWATVVSWTRRSAEPQTRQRIKVLQTNLDQLSRFQASDRDFYLYLFRWCWESSRFWSRRSRVRSRH